MKINNGEQVIDLARALGAMAKEADMVCVTRCKDCQHYNPDSDHCWMHQVDMESEDYCSYGERGDAE